VKRRKSEIEKRRGRPWRRKGGDGMLLLVLA